MAAFSTWLLGVGGHERDAECRHASLRSLCSLCSCAACGVVAGVDMEQGHGAKSPRFFACLRVV